MGSTHPSLIYTFCTTVQLAGVGYAAFLSLGERLVTKLGLDQLGLPSPFVNLHFRRCLYGYLLSLENIIQRILTFYIKINLQNRKLTCNEFHSTFIMSLSLSFIRR